MGMASEWRAELRAECSSNCTVGNNFYHRLLAFDLVHPLSNRSLVDVRIDRREGGSRFSSVAASRSNGTRNFFASSCQPAATRRQTRGKKRVEKGGIWETEGRGAKIENSQANYSVRSNSTRKIKRFEGTRNKYFAPFAPPTLFEGAGKTTSIWRTFEKRRNVSIHRCTLSPSRRLTFRVSGS